MLALVVGGLYLGARLLGLGVLATFLSRPILVGFFAGISLSIIVGQIGRVTGVEDRGRRPDRAARRARCARRAAIHWPSLALAAAMFALLQASRAPARCRSPGR